jgi:hypothetical protein
MVGNEKIPKSSTGTVLESSLSIFFGWFKKFSEREDWNVTESCRNKR